jgi:hypothetical protein
MQDLSEAVSEVMRFLLASNHSKPNVPVAYNTIVKLLKELQSTKTAIAKPVISHAKKKFLSFGWELAEIGTGAVSPIATLPD